MPIEIKNPFDHAFRAELIRKPATAFFRHGTATVPSTENLVQAVRESLWIGRRNQPPCHPVDDALPGAVAVERHDGSAGEECLRDGPGQAFAKRGVGDHVCSGQEGGNVLWLHEAGEFNGHAQFSGLVLQLRAQLAVADKEQREIRVACPQPGQRPRP